VQTKRILIPVDLDDAKRSLDALHFVNAMANEFSVEATLLHVIHLNVAVLDRRVEEELCARSEHQLRQLARIFLGQCATRTIRIRHGCPYKEIVAEAESSLSELVVLTPPKRSRWPFRSHTAERVLREASCFTLVLPRAWKITPERYRDATPPLGAGGSRGWALQPNPISGSAAYAYQ